LQQAAGSRKKQTAGIGSLLSVAAVRLCSDLTTVVVSESWTGSPAPNHTAICHLRAPMSPRAPAEAEAEGRRVHDSGCARTWLDWLRTYTAGSYSQLPATGELPVSC
jgi:hypothetical protein